MLKDMKDLCVGYYIVMLALLCIFFTMNSIVLMYHETQQFNYAFLIKFNVFVGIIFFLVCIKRVWSLLDELRKEN